MNCQFDVYLGCQSVGKVTIQKQGCFYVIDCFCSIPMIEGYKLILNSNDKEMNLGRFIPHSNGVGLKTRVKADTVDMSKVRFYILSAKSLSTSEFYPVYEDKPFAYLEKISQSVLQIRDGIYGIVIEIKN